jgi:hypothetical protein
MEAIGKIYQYCNKDLSRKNCRKEKSKENCHWREKEEFL